MTEEKGEFIILCTSEALHVVSSQVLRSRRLEFADLQMQLRFERLPQPEEGMDAFWHICWLVVVVSFLGSVRANSGYTVWKGRRGRMTYGT